MILRNHATRELCRRLLDRLEIVEDDQDCPASEDYEKRRLPENADELVNGLAEEFGEEQLIDSGIAVLDGEGLLTASLRLAPSGAILIPLFQAADRLPIDAVLSDGLLLGDEAPPYVAAHDGRLASAMRSSNHLLLVVPALEDVLACECLGMAAVPFAGMDRLNLIELHQLEEITSSSSQLLLPETIEQTAEGDCSSAAADSSDVLNRGMPEPRATQQVALDHDAADDVLSEDGFDVIEFPFDDSLPLEIIISGWSFARQQSLPEQEIQRLISRLAGAQRFLSIDLSAVAVWVPRPGDIQRISFCWDVRDRDAVRNAVLESISGACYSLSAAVSGRIALWQSPGTYLKARSALSRGLRNTENVPMDRSELVEVFEHCLQSQIIEPLLEDGVNHRDPIVGALHMELANISSLLQSQAPFLQHDLMQAGIRVESRDKRGTLERSIRIRMQLVDRLVRIVRELRR